MINANTPFAHIDDGDPCIYFLMEDRSRLRPDVVPRCKIGVTNRLDCTLRQFRMQILRASSAEDFIVFHAIKAPNKEVAALFERLLHRRFATKRSKHSKEWFDLSIQEIDWCQSLTIEQLDELRGN